MTYVSYNIKNLIKHDQRLKWQLIEIELCLNVVLKATAGAAQDNYENKQNEITITESAIGRQKVISHSRSLID